jgi:mannose-6-phosphate isomerase-like protein (cupin superfamily)
MSSTTSQQHYALNSREGNATWFLGTLMTVKAGHEETGGAFTLIEAEMPAGFSPPPHVHHDEDEAFYILAGELTVFCNEETFKAGAGSFIFLPKGSTHSFTVEGSEPARMLQLTLPAGFEHFAAEVGEPAQTLTLPPPAVPDVAKLVSVAAKYNIDINVPPSMP